MRHEPVGDDAVELDEVGDVVRRVLALLCAERPARPVRQLVALLEAQPQQLLDEHDERGRRQAEEPRRELRVEKPRRGGTARPLEDLEVLVGGVDDGQSRTGKHGGEGRDIDGERVDERDPTVPGDLEEGEPGEVAPLTVELGVERVLVGAPELVDESAERDLVGDVTEFDRWRPVRAPHRHAAPLPIRSAPVAHAGVLDAQHLGFAGPAGPEGGVDDLADEERVRAEHDRSARVGNRGRRPPGRGPVPRSQARRRRQRRSACGRPGRRAPA